MPCTKSQLLALLSKIRDEMLDCEDKDCCISIIQTYISAISEKTYHEIEKEIFT